jgi:uncharacterized protein DUF4129
MFGGVRVTGRPMVRRRWGAIVAMLALASVAALGTSEAAPAPDVRPLNEIDHARQHVLDEAYQDELPFYGPGRGSGAAGAPGRRASGELDEARDQRFDARAHDDRSAVSSLMTIVLWGLVIVLGVLGAFWLASELSRYGGDAELPADEAQARLQAATAAIIDRPLGDADELARLGEHAEAIHTLLLRTLQELARTVAVRIAPAMTSREVLARVPLLADARAALAGLITAVELTYFGDEPANADDYARCRQQFHVFATAFRGGTSYAVAA